MEAQSRKSSCLNLNPLAPAQSKRTFAFSGKTQNVIEHASIVAFFFYHLLYMFRAFSRTMEKGVQCPALEPYKYTKINPKGAQTEPKHQQIAPQGATKNKENAKLFTKGVKVEPQVIQWSPKVPPIATKTYKSVKSDNKARKRAAKS